MNLELETSNIDTDKEPSGSVRMPFREYSPDVEEIVERAEERDFRNLVVIGNGGSITSFRALYYAFHEEVDRRVFILTTQDPDQLHSVSRRTSPEDTLVMPVSKSGSTTTVIESLLFFLKQGYRAMPLTSENDGALRQIVEKRDLRSFEHPDVGGRFSGGTETALAPAAMAGLDIEEFRKGIENAYSELETSGNIADKAARKLYAADERGFSEVLTPFYSSRLFGFYPLLVQLMHETVAKEGKGQTFFGDLGPEYQHHTNQRLFGGREDIVPFFFLSEGHDRETIEVPGDLEEVSWKNRSLGGIDGLEYAAALESEYQGVRQELENRGRPQLTLRTGTMNYRTVGELMAFMQHLAVYSAELRGVDPFTQPEVEKSKEIGFRQRFER